MLPVVMAVVVVAVVEALEQHLYRRARGWMFFVCSYCVKSAIESDHVIAGGYVGGDMARNSRPEAKVFVRRREG